MRIRSIAALFVLLTIRIRSIAALFVLLTIILWLAYLATLAKGAAPPALKQSPVYLDPVKFHKVTFNDKKEGFGIVWEIKKKDFINGIVPETMTIHFHGPQPIIVKAREYVHVNDRDLTLEVLPIKGHWIRENYNNSPIRLVAYFNEPPDRHEKKWKNYEIKLVPKYLTADEKRINLFQFKVHKINGVIGSGTIDNKDDNKWYIQLAKGHPKLKKIKEEVEALAKKQKVEVIRWDEKEGYDYTWKKGKNED